MTTLEELALTAAILADPDDDTARLVYADWLQEQEPGMDVECPRCHGDGAVAVPPPASAYMLSAMCGTCSGTGTLPDTGRRDRAEFIRVQCKLARTTGPDGLAHPTYCVCPVCVPLRARESALLAPHRAEWSKFPCPECEGQAIVRRGLPPLNAIFCPACGGTGDLFRYKIRYERETLDGIDESVEGIRDMPVTFARGFPDSVAAPLATWVDQTHNTARARRVYQRPDWRIFPTPRIRAVATRTTVRAAPPSDREPFDFNLFYAVADRGWSFWHGPPTDYPASTIPRGLWESYTTAGGGVYHPTADTARFALGAGLIRLAKGGT